MKRGGRGRKSSSKQSLNLPDLDQAKSAVLNSLPSKESERGYQHAIDEFAAWYCSEPRLSFNSTVNRRLAAGRRLAYQVGDKVALSLRRDPCVFLGLNGGFTISTDPQFFT
jgi:hypothetical protein